VAKQTSLIAVGTSAFDPKREFADLAHDPFQRAGLSR